MVLRAEERGVCEGMPGAGRAEGGTGRSEAGHEGTEREAGAGDSGAGCAV